MARATGPDAMVQSPPADLVSELVRFAMMAGDRLQEHGVRRLAILGTAPGEGATTITCLLGQVLAAHRGLRVLLFEGNLLQPDLGRVAGVADGPGWRDRLDEAPDSIAVPTPWPNVWACPYGPTAHTAEERAVSEERLAAFLEHAAASYDLVLLDCAPLAYMGESLEIARQADAALLVIEADRLPREALVHSCATLDSLDAHFLGAILNRHEHPIPRFLYGNG